MVSIFHKFGDKKIVSLVLFLKLIFPSTNLFAQPLQKAPDETMIADRVVLAINNIPYTQLQIESYLNVKESLRDNADSSQVVNAGNWVLAVDAFTKDMMIHQEATKSSGFRPTREAIQKLRSRSEKIQSSTPQFKAAFDRLMLSRSEIEREILRIATVENYRKGKATLAGTNKEGRISWEEELEGRTIVRLYDGAKSWRNIQPRL